jgi:hypothetical protein
MNIMTNVVVKLLFIVLLIVATVSIVHADLSDFDVEYTTSYNGDKVFTYDLETPETLTLTFDFTTTTPIDFTVTNTSSPTLSGAAASFEALYSFRLTESGTTDAHSITLDYSFDETTTMLYLVDSINFGFLVDNEWTVGVGSRTSEHINVTMISSELFSTNTYVDIVILVKPNTDGCLWSDKSLLKWSDANTWGGSVPSAGQVVTIPANKTVLVDIVNVPALAGVIIPSGSTLIFDNKPIQLTTGFIWVNGSLFIGEYQDECRITENIVITLESDNSDVLGQYGTQAIVVGAGGELHLNGKAPQVAWTKLVQNADEGTTTVLVEDEVDWVVGQTIAIAPTDFDPSEASEYKIQSIAADKKTILLDGILNADRFGQQNDILSEKAEVAVLDRNIKIQGPANSDSTKQGAYIVVTPGFSTANIVGIELTSAGQAGHNRRYPITFDNIGAGTLLISDNSIHRTYNRCIGLRNVQGLFVTTNLCYDIQGHAISLEEGSEYDNTFFKNLIIGVKSASEGSQIIESTPAGFFILNPNNTWSANQVSGSSGYGFWFALPTTVLGDSLNVPKWSGYTPNTVPLAGFAQNYARSISINGLHIDNGVDASGGTTVAGYAPTSTAQFYQFQASKCRQYGIHSRGGNQNFVESAVANTWGGIHLADSPYVTMGNNERQGVYNTNILKTTTNAPNSEPLLESSQFYSLPRRGVHSDGGVNAIVGVTFSGYTGPDACFAPYGYEPVAPIDTWADISCNTQNLLYVQNFTSSTVTDAERFFVALQASTDGEYSAVSIAANNNFLSATGCTVLSQYAMKCPVGSYVQIKMYDEDFANTVYPADLTGVSGASKPHVTLARLNPTTKLVTSTSTITGLSDAQNTIKKTVYPFTAVTSTTDIYGVIFKHQTPKKLKVVVDYIPNNAGAIVAMCFHPTQSNVLSVIRNGNAQTKTTSEQDFFASTNKYYLDTTGRLMLRAYSIIGNGQESNPTTYQIQSTNGYTESYDCFQNPITPGTSNPVDSGNQPENTNPAGHSDTTEASVSHASTINVTALTIMTFVSTMVLLMFFL